MFFLIAVGEYRAFDTLNGEEVGPNAYASAVVHAPLNTTASNAATPTTEEANIGDD